MPGPRTKRPMRPDDILRIRWVGEPKLSPDGGRVAYVVTMLDEKKDEYRSHIHVVEVKGGETRQLTNGPKRDTAPAWSPDGRSIAFVSERGEEKAQVWVIAADGGEAWRLTKTEQPAANPAWSPDGRRIAFTSRVESNPGRKAPTASRCRRSARSQPSSTRATARASSMTSALTSSWPRSIPKPASPSMRSS